MLRLAHTPNDGAWTVLVEPGRHLEHLSLFDAADFLDLVGCPLGHHILAHFVHAEHAVVDVLLVFPAVLEDVVQHTKQEGDVRARTDTHVFVGLGRCAGETRIHHNHLAAGFLGVQHVQHAHGVGFGGVGANVERNLCVLHVVVGVGHGAVAPCVGHASHRGRMADTRLVVAVVRAEVAHKLAHQVGLLVAVFGRAHPVHRIGPAGLAQVEHLGADLVERRVPADTFVFAVDQLHRVTQPVFTVAMFTQCRTFGAVCAEVDGGVEHRLLAHPDTVFNHRIRRTTHRAVATHRAFDFDLAGAHTCASTGCGLGLLDQRQLGCSQANPDTQTRTPQESPAVHGGQGL